MKSRVLAALRLGCALFFIASVAEAAKMDEMAAKFGARESVSSLRLSPDGSHVSYLIPRAGQGSALIAQSLAEGAKAKPLIAVSGDLERLEECYWISGQRLACSVFAVIRYTSMNELVNVNRLLSVPADGGKTQLLDQRQGFYTRGVAFGGASMIDRLTDKGSSVLLTRIHMPDDRTGSRIGSSKQGLGVDEVDSENGIAKKVETPHPDAFTYITDGHGNVRIRGLLLRDTNGDLRSGRLYQYRKKGSSNWEQLADFDSVSGAGFEPIAINYETDSAYGLVSKDGFHALYTKALDGSGRMEPVFAAPGVDVDTVIAVGPHQRVVGVTYATESRHYVYFDPELHKLAQSLEKALPGRTVRIVDTSDDEKTILLWAGADNDPGVYYILNRATKQMRTFLVARSELEGVKLATVRSVSYPAADGTMIPAYLTLPTNGRTKDLPTIVMPHGGPAARDEWGFDWMAQFFANQGYAVLQPNFRGSSGYGEQWFQENGYRSWKTAIGDVLDAGRWMVKEGTADARKLAIVGWSYGGYAALQSAVTDPGLFKAVVAIAPVTDLDLKRKEWAEWTNRKLVSQQVGDNVAEASPARHADRIKAPVLMFHGAMDRNVGIRQSEVMRDALVKAGGKVRLVTWDNLDHYLDDSEARTTMLGNSADFLSETLGN